MIGGKAWTIPQRPRLVVKLESDEETVSEGDLSRNRNSLIRLCSGAATSTRRSNVEGATKACGCLLIMAGWQKSNVPTNQQDRPIVSQPKDPDRKVPIRLNNA